MTLRAAAAAAKRFIGQGVASRAVVPRSSGAALQRSATLTTSAVRPPTECITFASHQTRTFFSKERSKSVYEYGAHRSDAEARIAEMPIVQVDGPVALCEGGGGALGHPLDYIQLANPGNTPQACQYCGIRYQMKQH